MIGKDGKTRYYYQGQEYENLQDIRGFLGQPLRSTSMPKQVGETLQKVSEVPGVSHLFRTASKIGELTELPGEEKFANLVGQGAQNWGLPYWTGQTLGYLAYPGFGEAKALTKSMEAAQLGRKTLQPAFATVGVNDGLLSTAVREGVDLNPRMFAFQRQPRTEAVKQQIIESLPFKPKTVKKNIWGNYIEKFGSKEGALAALKKAETSKAYLKKHGSLKGNNNLWTDPVSGEVFLVNNKTSRAAKLKGEITIGFDNIKNVERTLANRLKGAKLDTKKIEEIGKGLGWDDVKIQKYIESNEQAKRTLEALIKDLNKAEGRTMWSLGHRTAVKHLPHSADRALNIELEPLVDVITKEGRKISGNTGRAANDELIDLFKKITNNPADLKSDMIHWGDSLVGNLMPRMREITNADDFFKEIVKREDFLNNIKIHAKKNNLTLEQAADELLEPLMKKYPIETQPTYYD